MSYLFFCNQSGRGLSIITNLINGYGKIEELYRYFPTFHDDSIENIEIKLLID